MPTVRRSSVIRASAPAAGDASNSPDTDIVTDADDVVTGAGIDVSPDSEAGTTIELDHDGDGDDGDGDDDDDEAIHDSWKIYSKFGNKCVVCYGRGYNECLYCYGKGTIRIGPDVKRDTVTCPICGGTGREMCMRCEGTGIRPSFRYVLNKEGGLDVIKNLTNAEVCELPSQAEVEAQEETERQRQRHEQQRQDASVSSPTPSE